MGESESARRERGTRKRAIGEDWAATIVGLLLLILVLLGVIPQGVIP
ncbi:hypothetical protein SAMN05421505_105268 [Sinosporangium album]|uniref:Uncharacterized protein n=1 Tax=Sinosporangium album TaxID=504805 RepID=A0A1G7VHK4_9ACTN|nr:hypothetical protein [Sinosporangium album]SDG59038.1 hypothetical protein SAMN05421505_105268 [Sinosporangium album]